MPERMASRPMSILELVTLKEYAPLDHLFKLLPRKAQRALTINQSPINVEWLCVDASSEFIVLGSNISVVYLYDRQEQQLTKLKCEDKTCQVSCVKILTSLDHQLAVGTSNGHVEIYLLPSRSHGHAIQPKKFVLEHLHQTSPVTCIEWSSNGMKLFSGDTEGKVVQTDVDFYENQCRASCIMNEEEDVVQLNYSHKKLAVSTNARTVLCTPEEGNRLQQVGQQPRKSGVCATLPQDNYFNIRKGNYGVHFVPGLRKQSDATLYISRPGWRLWHANIEGVVLETIMFKDLIGAEHPSVQLLPGTTPEMMPPPSELQFGQLLPFGEGLVVSWSMSSVVVLQPFGVEGALIVASNFGDLGNILSVAVTRHEIFVLRKGCERSLVRIATAPELQVKKESKLERDFGRIQTIKLNLISNLSHTEPIPSMPVSSQRSTSTKLRNKFNSVKGFFSKAADELSDKAVETKHKMERNLERSFKLNFPGEDKKSDDNISVRSDQSSVSGEDQPDPDPPTPEAMLSERLMVSMINASTMSGEVSPAERASPTAFRSPANSFSSKDEHVKTNSFTVGKEQVLCNGKQSDTVENLHSDNKSNEDTSVESSQLTEQSENVPKHAAQNDLATDSPAIEISENPEEDRTATVVENLSKRQSAAYKISKDTLESIDGDFSKSIVFQAKPKSRTTKKKKKTIKGHKYEATIVDIGQKTQKPALNIPPVLSPSKIQPDPPASNTPVLSSIQEGEAPEEGPAPTEGETPVKQETFVDGKVSVDTKRMSYNPEMNPFHQESGSTHLDPIQEEQTSNETNRMSYDPVLNPFHQLSPPHSLKSIPEGASTANNRMSYDPVMNPFHELPGHDKSKLDRANVRISYNDELDPFGGGALVSPPGRGGEQLNGSADKLSSISLPKSLNSEGGLSGVNEGDESIIVSPNSPRGLLSLDDSQGKHVRRLGVILEDFTIDSIPEGALGEDEEVIGELPSVSAFKKSGHHSHVMKSKGSLTSRPVSEFEDIYSAYRRTIMLPKESLDEEEEIPQTVANELKDPLNSDNSETESHESDEGEEPDAALPESIQQKLAGSWMQCSTPNYILQLVASERHIWYVDSRDKAHHSLSADIACKWSKLKDAPSRVIAVSPSGSIVWRVHPKTNIACASTSITQRSPIGFRWLDVSRDVAHVCLDEHVAWIIKLNGQVCVQRGLSRDKPHDKDVLIESSIPLAQIAANHGVVWARTLSNKVVYRSGITSKKPQGEQWKDLADDENLKVVCIALDSQNTGWAIDEDGMVWFRTSVTTEKPMGDDQKWWQVCMSEYLMEDPNVLRMMVNMAGSATKVDRVVNWLKKQCYKATAIAACSSGVWVCSSYHYKTTLHVSKGNLLGSRWELSNPVGVAASATWKCVCASSSYGPSGMIWALQTSGEIFCFSAETRKPTAVQSPDGVHFNYMSATTNSVWALSSKEEIYLRMDMSERCPQGSKWKKLDVAQFGTRHIVHFTCGSEVVWAVDSTGAVHFRLSVKMPQHDALPLAWVPVDGKPVGYGTYFTHVFCGPTDGVVWALDNRKTVYVRQGVSDNMPLGISWEPVEGTQAQQLCISTDSVWALCPNGELACRFGISSRNVVGDYWKKISGNFKYLTVSQNDELWTVSNDGRLFHRLTKMFTRRTAAKAAAMETTLTKEEDDWELL